MEKKYMTGAVRFLMIAILANILLVSQGGCESRSRTEVVGFPRSFADLADKVKPAVVNIRTTSIVTVPGNPFKHFFGGEDQGPFGDFFHNFFKNMP
jgi:serine protease Do